jgi:hypothetical protein
MDVLVGELTIGEWAIAIWRSPKRLTGSRLNSWSKACRVGGGMAGSWRSQRDNMDALRGPVWTFDNRYDEDGCQLR